MVIRSHYYNACITVVPVRGAYLKHCMLAGIGTSRSTLPIILFPLLGARKCLLLR